MEANIMPNGLPPGFIIDEPQTAKTSINTLPTGFVVDQPALQADEPGFLEQAGTFAKEKILEPAAAITTGVISEPIAGVTGIGALLRGASPEVAEQEINQVREALTFRPRSKGAKDVLKNISKIVEPVSEKLQEVRQSTGDMAFRATGSPTVAAVATALPDATIEALGFGFGRKMAQAKTGLKSAPAKIAQPGKVSDRSVTKSLLEAAPEVNQIKEASRAIYKEIDDLNVVAKQGATRSLIRKVVGRAKKENVDDVLTPKSARVVDRFVKELDDPRPRSLTDIDQLRKQAQIAAQSIDPSDARLGAIMVDEIDDFLDKLPQGALSGPDAKTVANIGERYKAARNLWGRARRAELVSEAFDKANLQASGFENGIRTQLRSIINNKKRSRFFTKDELQSMRDVVKGTSSANLQKLIGRLGFSEGAATNILGGLGGAAVLGPAAPVVGQISRKLAQKTTEKAAQQVETLIRGGAKGSEITKAYLRVIPKGKRSVEELSDILLSSGSEVDDLLKSSNKIAKEAAEITRARRTFERAQAAGAAAPQVIPKEQEQQ